MRLIRIAPGFLFMVLVVVISFAATWFACASRVGVGYGLALALVAHFALLFLVLRLSPLVPRLLRAPCYTLHEAVVPYVGQCRSFEPREEFPAWAHRVEAHFETIQREFEDALIALEQAAAAESERRPDDRRGGTTGGWAVDRNAALMTRQRAWQHLDVATHCPKTFQLLSEIQGFRGECSFSKLGANARIKLHSGESDLYYRCHLGIRIPGPLPKAGFEVGGDQRSWEEGKLLIFCDAHPHTAWNDFNEERVILLFNVVRPEFVRFERRFHWAYRFLLYLKGGITSGKSSWLRRAVFVWLTMLGVIYANWLSAFGADAASPVQAES
jgi:hypothetical protein